MPDDETNEPDTMPEDDEAPQESTQPKPKKSFPTTAEALTLLGAGREYKPAMY